MYSYFVGINIAKNTYWVSILSSDGETISEPLVRVIFKMLKAM